MPRDRGGRTRKPPPELDPDPRTLLPAKPRTRAEHGRSAEHSSSPASGADAPTPAPDPLLHQPTRLRIMLHLYLRRVGEFAELQKALALTPGNLQAHLAALEKAGYLEIKRGFIELKPRARYIITPLGSAAVKGYAAYLEEVLADVARVVDGGSPGAASAGPEAADDGTPP